MLATLASVLPTLAWYRDVLRSDWSKPSGVKAQLGNARILQEDHAVFNIGAKNIEWSFGSIFSV
jgi:mRNA-degrading endonuclease HigB of HigAB toxin-antitoxin module